MTKERKFIFLVIVDDGTQRMRNLAARMTPTHEICVVDVDPQALVEFEFVIGIRYTSGDGSVRDFFAAEPMKGNKVVYRRFSGDAK